MLTRTTRLAVESALNNGYFRAEDFEIEESGSREVTLRISYRYESACYLLAELIASEREYAPKRMSLSATFASIGAAVIEDDGYKISGSICPGTLTNPESFSSKSLAGFIEAIEDWLRVLRQESKADPKWRDLTAWRADVEKKLEELIPKEAGQEPLSASERQSLKDRLDELEAKLRDHLDAEVKDKAELQRRLDELHATVEFLKEQTGKLDRMPLRKAWIARLYGWMSKEDNRKLLQTGADFLVLVADTTKKLL